MTFQRNVFRLINACVYKPSNTSERKRTNKFRWCHIVFIGYFIIIYLLIFLFLFEGVRHFPLRLHTEMLWSRDSDQKSEIPTAPGRNELWNGDRCAPYFLLSARCMHCGRGTWLPAEIVITQPQGNRPCWGKKCDENTFCSTCVFL